MRPVQRRPRPWEARRAIAVAAGGAAGAAVRWAVVTSMHTGTASFPWPVFAMNVAGSVLLGVVLAEEWAHPRARLLLHDLGGIGFCGGLTTFSTFAVEVVDLWSAGRAAVATVYALASVIAAVAGLITGAGALRRVRAIALPLEEEP